MQYLTTYYWQQGEHNATSLVLQQVYLKKTKTPMVLACICTDTTVGDRGRRFAIGLTDWFYATGLPLCDRGGKKVEKALSDSLERYLAKNDLQSRMAGVLCVGHSLWMFRQGGQEICLLNTRNLRPNCRDMGTEEKEADRISFQRGSIERGVGILLATEGLYRQISREVLAECLDMGKLRSQSRLDKRLRELGCKGEAQGGMDMGAILLTAW